MQLPKDNPFSLPITRVRKRSAFTLVELLVVVGIIAVLVSILLPALGMAREASKTTKCLSNLHQIGLAIEGYSNEHSYCLVPGDHWGIADKYIMPGGGTWADVLVDGKYITAPIGYIKYPGDVIGLYDRLYDADNILRCPNGTDNDVLAQGFPTSQVDGRGRAFVSRASETTLETVRNWYAINASTKAPLARPLPFNVIPYRVGGTTDWHLNRVTQFHNPSVIPLVFDGVWMFENDPNRINARHGGTKLTNILFADGHGEGQSTATLPNNDWYLN